MKNISLLLLEIIFFIVGGCFIFPLFFVIGVIYSIVDLDFVAKLTYQDRLKLADLLQEIYKEGFLNGYSLNKKNKNDLYKRNTLPNHSIS